MTLRSRSSSSAAPPRRRFRRLTALVAACWLAVQAAFAATPSPEYLIKAAYLYNFVLFVEWPPEAFKNADSPFVIGLVGADPIDGALERTIGDKRINRRAIVVRRLQPNQDLKQVHILFVSGPETARHADLVAKTEGQPVLVVGETPGFAERGGAINFVIDENRVRFEVNPETARKARLRVSAKLLNLAIIVRPS